MSDTPTDPREEKPSDERQTMLRRLRELESQLFPLQRERDQLAADLKNALDGQEYYKNEADVAAKRLAKLAAEVERLKTACEKEFQSVEQLSGENIKLAAEIAELRKRAHNVSQEEANELQTILRTLAPSGRAFVNSARQLVELWEKGRTKLETARQALFQTEKRLDDKLRAALAELEAQKQWRNEAEEKLIECGQEIANHVAELEAARKERDEYAELASRALNQNAELNKQRDTALAAKDAAEKRVRDLERTIEDAPHSQHCKFIPPILRTEMQDASGMFDCTCWKNLAPAPTQEPPAGGVTISTEKKGGEAGMFIESPPMKGASDVQPEGRPADVPSEGRGELLPFNLSDALAGKPVVTRDGQSVRYEDCVNNIIFAWIGDARMMWWDNGKFTHRSEPDPLDLFMLPTEGSGA